MVPFFLGLTAVGHPSIKSATFSRKSIKTALDYWNSHGVHVTKLRSVVPTQANYFVILSHQSIAVHCWSKAVMHSTVQCFAVLGIFLRRWPDGLAQGFISNCRFLCRDLITRFVSLSRNLYDTLQIDGRLHLHLRS